MWVSEYLLLHRICYSQLHSQVLFTELVIHNKLVLLKYSTAHTNKVGELWNCEEFLACYNLRGEGPVAWHAIFDL